MHLHYIMHMAIDTDRKQERLVTLISADDLRRIMRYCDKKNINRSVLVRDTVLSAVRKWEKKAGYHDAETARV